MLRALIRIISLPFYLVPAKLRTGLIRGLVVVDSRIGNPADSLRRAFSIADTVNLVIAERATAYGAGEHPKHRLMAYHDFFVENIEPGSRVIDVGCGYGAVARSIANRVTDVEVLGIDLDAGRMSQAKAADNPPNLTFVAGDVLTDLPTGEWDAVVMSNVLEHIDGRVAFLKDLAKTVKPARVLIRVPLFERDWHVPMRRELGVDYFSDKTHFIEHTLAEFADELAEAGYEVVDQQIKWGEIWSVTRPR